MKKKVGIIVAILIAMTALFVACGCEEKEPVKRTLSIDNVTVMYEESVTIEPQFSVEGDHGAVTYSYDGGNISIKGDVITGLVGNTETVVTATCEDLETTFIVTVLYENPLGENAYTKEFDDVFTAIEDGKYQKSSTKYGEAYYYVDGEALAGTNYLLTGRLELNEAEEEGYAAIVVRESQVKAVRYSVVFEGRNGYALYVEYMDGANDYGEAMKLRSLDSNRLDYTVLVYGGKVYLYCGEIYTSQSAIDVGNVHVGIGGANAIVTASRMRSYKDEKHINEYLDMTKVIFGAHAFGGGNYDNNAFVPMAAKPGYYTKTSMGYGQTFYYHNGLPVAGEEYTIEFDISCELPTPSGAPPQATFMFNKDDNNMARFVMEYRRDGEADKAGKWYFFTDLRREGMFGQWQELQTLSSHSLRVKLVYDHGTCALFINGSLVKVVEEEVLGQTHLGFGGEQCQITIGNISARFTADAIEN